MPRPTPCIDLDAVPYEADLTDLEIEQRFRDALTRIQAERRPDVISVPAGSSLTATDVVTRHTKTPAPVLLVDDDRWYSFADQFKEALDLNGIPYDYWYVPKSWSGPVPPSPRCTS